MRTVVLSLLLAAAAHPAEARRIAIVVGNNEAGRGLEPLRYAEQDAVSVKRVLTDLAGVGTTVTLLAEQPEALRQVFAEVAKQVEPGGDPVTLFFFYSGHADDHALLMRGGRFEFTELRRSLAGLPVELFVAVIDACQSGALARAKGGSSVPLVNLDLYEDEKSQKGGVFITSGSVGEAAQESDDIGSSFFTHYLLSALRGAADDSGDRRVSLEEAYRFAYTQTLDRTRMSLLGPQHPSWEVNIHGQGQLVLTWLTPEKSYFVLSEAASGRWMFRDMATAQVSAEVYKQGGKPLRVAVDPGAYEVIRVEADHIEHQELRLDAGRELDVDAGRMVSAPLALLRGKGPGEPPRSIGVSYRAGSGYLREAAPSHGISARLTLLSAGRLSLTARASFGESSYVRRDQISVALTEIGGALGAEVALIESERARFFASLDLDLRAALQAATARDGKTELLAAPVFGPELRLGILFPMTSWAALSVAAGGAARVYEGPEGVALRPEAVVEVGVRAEL